MQVKVDREVLAAIQDECKRVGQLNAELLAALKAAESVMARHIYPKPDVDDEHPYAVLKRMRAVIAKAKGD